MTISAQYANASDKTSVYLNDEPIFNDYNPVSISIIGILQNNEYKLNISGGYGAVNNRAGGVYLSNNICPKNSINTFQLITGKSNYNYKVSAIGL